MQNAPRGRPRRTDIDRLALEHALGLLEERGYDGLRMKDVAESAGIGLGALYRRWAGKKELVMAALRADMAQHEEVESGDPLTDLDAALGRIADAMPNGLGRLIAACLSQPNSELARVAREAKLAPMADGLTARLEKVIGPVPDARQRAESGLSYLIWSAAVARESSDAQSLRDQVLSIMGATSPQAGKQEQQVL
ncbi:TetR/AcrR family transcriptional regulator [Streptomyces mirabilis]|uniref:TetR/AcrR family transcriptional regulator n=1 Tax=Streptomyces mirabilis TaxID=68239 RepID=UPI0033C128D8